MTSHDTDSHAGLTVDGWGETPHWGIRATLFLASCALLTLEVSLTRFFSYTVWYHMAYLTISMAILGFGSSGAIVAAFPDLFRRHGQNLVVAGLVSGAVLTAIALREFSQHPLQVAELAEAMKSGVFPSEFVAMLLLYYLGVGLPFLLAGFAIGLPFSAYPNLMGRLYFWDLLGAALGCLVVVGLIEVLTVPGLIMTAAGLMLVSAAVMALGGGSPRSGWTLALVAAVVLLVAIPMSRNHEPSITAGKPQFNAMPLKGRPDWYHAWTALSRVDAYGWKFPSRLAYWGVNGISPDYRGPRPLTATVNYDGGNGSEIMAFDGDFDEFEFFDAHILKSPYVVKENPRVLVIGVGGGIDMLNAARHGAEHVTGVELQPKTVHVLKEVVREFNGDFFHRPDVDLVAGEGRHFISKATDRYDVIQITAVDTFAAQATGAYVMAESYLYTVEAFEEYLDHLQDDGVLSLVVGGISYKGAPPLATRTSLNGFRALQRMGVEHPEDHIFAIGAMSTRNAYSQSDIILIKRSPFVAEEVDKLKAHAERNGFDVLYAPAKLADSEHKLSVLLGGDEDARQAALVASDFDMDAVYDADPFFYNVGRWRDFWSGGFLNYTNPGSFIGQLVLVLMVVQSTIIGFVLIIMPLLLGAREGLKVPGVASYVAYFLALGVGFMFIEVSFIQSFVLFLGSPTHALSVTIFSLLLFAGIGSLLSGRFVDDPEANLKYVVGVLTVLVVLYVIGLAPMFRAFLQLPFETRVLIAVAAQCPIGLTLGMFMPLGIAAVARRHARLVPWAWGINGVGSVLGTTLAVIVAMTWGFPAVSVLAVGLYIIGTALLLSVRRHEESA